MKKTAFLLTLMFFLFFVSCGEDTTDKNEGTDQSELEDSEQSDADSVEIVFTDEAFIKCIKDLTQTEEIDPQTLAQIKILRCTGMGITDISGIEAFTSLETLSLFENSIEDISKIAGLATLKEIELGVNSISDISVLSGLTAVEKLSISFNKLSNVSTLKQNTAVKWLNLDGNKISDISPLLELPELEWVTVEQNPVSNWSVADEFTAKGIEIYYSYRNYGIFKNSLSLKSGKEISELVKPVITPVLGADNKITFQYEDQVGNIRTAITTFSDVDLDQERSYKFIYGIKYPSFQDSGVEPVVTVKVVANSEEPQTEDQDPDAVFNKLDPFVMASPNQLDGGTCLFMANTGTMETLRNQKLNITDAYTQHDSDNDFSERFLINASDNVPKAEIQYHITDIVKTFDHFKGGMLNRDYPFTLGYLVEEENGSIRPAESSTEEGAYLSCYYNWLDDLPENYEELVTETPEVDRTIIFIDPDLNENSIWNLAIMNDNVVERVKYELRTRNAPVVVVYNHFLYWHAVMVVGYDDNDTSQKNCPFVTSSLKYYKEKGADGYVQKLQNYLDKENGCAEQGVFYVRDSIYEGESTPENMYKYNSEINYSEPYSERIVKHSYDWLKFLGNHAYTVHRK